MNIEALRTLSPDKPAPTAEVSHNIPPPSQISPSSPILVPPISDAALAQAQAPDIQQLLNIPPPTPLSPVIVSPVSDAALAQAQAPDIQKLLNIPPPTPSSPVIVSPISDAALAQAQAPDIQQSMTPIQVFPFKAQPPGHRPILQIPKRRNDHSRVMVATNALGAITEKTRIVEQPDLITRRIIEIKDQKISQLEAQVKNYVDF
jgi:hypothetical protein